MRLFVNYVFTLLLIVSNLLANNITEKESYYQKAIKISKQCNFGKNKIIAILDTGINDNNNELKGKVIAEYDFTTNSPKAIDKDGHGTRMASIIASANNGEGITGIAYNAKLIDAKVVDDSGEIKTKNIIRAIKFAVKHGANVINMSFSSGEYSQKLQDVIAKYAKKGVIFVASAGNEGSNEITYPAGYNYVVAVGSLNRKTGKRAVYSNYGKWVNKWVEDGIWTYDGKKYSRGYGTSEAAAVVSGYIKSANNLNNKYISKKANINLIDYKINDNSFNNPTYNSPFPQNDENSFLNLMINYHIKKEKFENEILMSINKFNYLELLEYEKDKKISETIYNALDLLKAKMINTNNLRNYMLLFDMFKTYTNFMFKNDFKNFKKRNGFGKDYIQVLNNLLNNKDVKKIIKGSDVTISTMDKIIKSTYFKEFLRLTYSNSNSFYKDYIRKILGIIFRINIVNKNGDYRGINSNVLINRIKKGNFVKALKFFKVLFQFLNNTKSYIQNLNSIDKNAIFCNFIAIKGYMFLEDLKNYDKEMYYNNTPTPFADNFIKFIHEIKPKDFINMINKSLIYDTTSSTVNYVGGFIYDFLKEKILNKFKGIQLQVIKLFVDALVENFKNGNNEIASRYMYENYLNLISKLKTSILFNNKYGYIDSKILNQEFIEGVIIKNFMFYSTKFLLAMAKNPDNWNFGSFSFLNSDPLRKYKITNDCVEIPLTENKSFWSWLNDVSRMSKLLVEKSLLSSADGYIDLYKEIKGQDSEIQVLNMNYYLKTLNPNDNTLTTLENIFIDYNQNISKNINQYLYFIDKLIVEHNFFDEVATNNITIDNKIKYRENLLNYAKKILGEHDIYDPKGTDQVNIANAILFYKKYGYSLIYDKYLNELNNNIYRKDYFIMLMKAAHLNPYADEIFMQKLFNGKIKPFKDIDKVNPKTGKQMTFNEKVWLLYGKYKNIIHGDENGYVLPYIDITRVQAMAIAGRLYKNILKLKYDYSIKTMASYNVNKLHIIDYNQLDTNAYKGFKEDVDFCLADKIIVGAPIGDTNKRSLLLNNNLTIRQAVKIALRLVDKIQNKSADRSSINFIKLVGDIADAWKGTSAAQEINNIFKNISIKNVKSLFTIVGGKNQVIILHTKITKDISSKLNFIWSLTDGNITKIEKKFNNKGYLDIYLTIKNKKYTAPYLSMLTLFLVDNAGNSGQKNFYIRVLPYENYNTSPTVTTFQFIPTYLQNNQFKLNWDIKNAKAVRFEYSFDNQHWNKFDLINLLVSKKRQSIKEIKEAKNYQTIYFRADVLDKNNNHIYKIKKLSYIPSVQGGSNIKFTEIPAKTDLYVYQHGTMNSADVSWIKIVNSNHQLNVKYYELKYGKVNTQNFTLLKFNDNSNPNNFLSSNKRTINNLEDGATYYFQVRGCNDLGCGEWSNADFVTIDIPHSPQFDTSYQYPKNGATDVSKDGNLAWKALNDNGNLVYRIKFGTTPDNLKYASGWISDNSIYFSDLYIKKLHPNTTYYWQVIASDKGHRGDNSYYGGKYPSTPIWHFTTNSNGYDLTISDVKQMSSVKPDSYVNFAVTVKNIGNQPAPKTMIKAYYKKNNKITPFRIGGEVNTGKILMPGESVTVNMKLKFLDYIVEPNKYNGNIEYDNILISGKSNIIFDMPYLKYDGQDINFKNNKKDVVINYENKGAPQFKYFDIKFGAKSMFYSGDNSKFYAIAGEKLKIVANVVDDIKCKKAIIEYRTDEDNNWHLIKEFDNNSSKMIFTWKDKNGNQQGSSNSYDWIIPESLKDTNIQVKVAVYDDQGLVSSKTSKLFPIHSNFLELKNISLDKKEYKVGDKAIISFITENANPITKIKVTLKQKNNNKAIGVYEKYNEKGLNLNNKIVIQLPDNNYYTSDNSYFEITLRDIYDNEKIFETPIFKLKSKSNLPQFFSDLIELYKTLNTDYPTDKNIISKQSNNKILALKLDNNNLLHAIIQSDMDYIYKVRNGGRYNYYSAKNSKYIYIVYDIEKKQILSVKQVLQTTKDLKDNSGFYFKDFILINNKPYILFGENKLNEKNKYILIYQNGSNFTIKNILNSQFIKWNEIKFLKNDNNVYVTWVDLQLGNDSEHRRNKYMQIYPYFGNIKTFANFYLGHHLKIIDNKYLFGDCNTIYSIDSNMKVVKLLKKYNFSCGGNSKFKNFSNNSNILNAVEIYDSGIKMAFIDNKFNVYKISNNIQSPKTVIFDNFTLIDGNKNGDNYLDYNDTLFNKDYKFKIGEASTVANYNLVDINKNKKIVLATFGKTYISIADLSKDIIAPIVKFDNNITSIENGKNITLKWKAEDNKGLAKLDLYKIINNKKILIKEFTPSENNFQYHINENNDFIKFKIVAYDLSGNYAYDILPLKIKTPVILKSFNINKKEFNLSDNIVFSWESNGNKNSIYTIYKKEINDNNWTKLCDVYGKTKKIYTIKHFIGKYKFKISANNGGNELIYPYIITINGDLLQFNNKKFYPSGTIVKKGDIIPFVWDDNKEKTIYYDIWVKNDGEKAYKKIGVTTNKYYNFVKYDNKSFSWKIGANYNDNYIYSKEFHVKIEQLLPPKLNTAKLKFDNDAYVELNFTKVPQAVQYEILKSNCNEIFDVIGFNKENNFKDYNIKSGKCYSYKIISISRNNSLSKPSNEINVSTFLEKYNVVIENKNNQVLKNNYILLKYHPNKKVLYENYEIRLGKNPQNLSFYTITSNREINITALDYATTYYVEIYPLDFDNNRLSVIPATLVFTTGFDTRTITEKPVITLETLNPYQIQISWNKIPNADGYEIFRSDNDMNYSFLYKTENTQFTDNINLVQGKTYYYKIKAFNKNNAIISYPFSIKLPLDDNQQMIHTFNPITGEEKEFNSTTDIPKDWIEGIPIIINIPKGISLVSGNIDFHNLQDKHILIIWSLNPKTQEWIAYSPSERIRQKIKANGFRFIDKIDANRAFFVVANAPTKLVTYENIDDINETIDITNLPKGYSLVGSNNNEMSIDDIRCQDGYIVGGIFKYQSGKWQYVIPSINRYDFKEIEPNEGAMVQCIPQRGKK